MVVVGEDISSLFLQQLRFLALRQPSTAKVTIHPCIQEYILFIFSAYFIYT